MSLKMVYNVFPLSSGQLVLDITIGTTMLAIFPAAASVHFVSKVIDENDRTLWIMTTNMHSTAKILKFASVPLILAISIDIYFESLRMVGASVGYMLKSPFVDLKRIARY